jgi:hypothetical protein
MYTLRNELAVTSRNDTVIPRVKRMNSLGNWQYNPASSRRNIISSVPDSPIYPPFINELSTLSTLVISIYSLNSPENGMEDVESYEIFMKDATDEKIQFFLLGVINITS